MKFIVILIVLACNTAYAQDIAVGLQKNNPDQYNEYQQVLRIGTQVEKLSYESLEEFFKRLYPDLRLHHGIFRFGNWKNSHGSYVIGFAKSDAYFGIGMVSGLLFEPTGRSTFRIIKVGEWSDECTRTSVETVFRYNQKLFVGTQENCRINGVFNNVFVYSNTIVSNKLKLEDTLYEHCQYWWKGDEEEGDYVYPQGGEDTSNAEFVECELDTYEKIVNRHHE